MSKLSDKNRLSIVRPDLIEEWDYELNSLSPNDFTVSCRRMAHWKCKKCGHKWQANIVDRTRENNIKEENKNKIRYGGKINCPHCNSFGYRYPQFINEWSNKNTITPYEIGKGNYVAIWECSICEFEWEAGTGQRANGYGNCPKCNSFGVKFPYLLKDWDYNKNNISVDNVNYGSNISYWWKCNKCSYEWKASVGSRCSGNGCQKCSSIILKNGTICNSMVDAYFYLKFKEENYNFEYNKHYVGNGDMKLFRYDFYFPDYNKYIEVTGFHKKSLGVNYFSYLRNIVRKKRFVENVLNAKFEFISIKLNNNQYRYVRSNIF